MADNEASSAKEENKEEREVMDTPERGKNPQIATSIGKFEESPVFNFLNNLSPIKQVRSIHITQTINPLSFTSIPAVFTSPHVCSVKESRFFRRYQMSDPSKPEFSSAEESNAGTSNINMVTPANIVEPEKNLEPSAPEKEVVGDQSFECSKFVVECVEDPCTTGHSSALVLFKQEASQRVPQRNEANTAGGIQVDQSKEGAPPSEWDNLISGTSDLFIFESPNCTDSHKKSIDGMSFYASIEKDIQNMHSMCAFSSEQVGEGGESEHISTQPGEGSEMVENAETSDTTAGPSLISPGGKDLPGFCRGMRRRCLVFEIPGIRRKHLEDNLGSDPSLLLPADSSTSSLDQRVVSVRAGNDSSRHVLPAIGLHLNALATSPKGYKIVNHDSSVPGKLVIGPSSSVNFHASNISQELFDNAVAVPSNEETNGTENGVIPMDDAGQGQTSGYSANEEASNSPKKKRRRPDPVVEGESCKRCNCKKSKCLKLYCECFAAGLFCVEPCACIDCFNKPIHEDTVLATRKQIESRNPLAFAPKVIKGSDSMADVGDDSTKTPASARHKRGCNCKKSGCLKKYCECYQGGVGCSINCRCEGCKNAYGRKEGSSLILMETEAEEDKTDVNENIVPDRREKAVAKIELDKNIDSVPPATPLRALRQSAHLPFSSKKKPPRSSFPLIGSSSGVHTHKGAGNPSFQLQPKFNNHVEAVREEMPEFLQEGSPVAGVKSTSPNQKRVSPPRSEGIPSPGLRSSRKLILQSIPSFPSLSQNQ